MRPQSISSAEGGPPGLKRWPFVLVAILASLLVLGILVSIRYAQGATPVRQPLLGFLVLFWKSEEWQHCWLVIPGILAVLYVERARLRLIPVQGSSLFGGAILVLAFAAYWVGYRVDNYYAGYLSIHLLIIGLVLWFGGWPWLKGVAFLLGFLVFLWPLHFFESTITFPLRMIMSSASAAVIDGIGIPIVRQGTGILSAPDPALGIPAGARFKVDVADPCSGIRSLFALMMISALYAHFTLKTWWQKWILFLSSIPLAVVGNLCRILMLTIGTIAFGADFAIGKDALTEPSWFHMMAGYFVFAVALAGMIGVSAALGTLTARGPNDPRLSAREWLRQRMKGPETARRSASQTQDPY